MDELYKRRLEETFRICHIVIPPQTPYSQATLPVKRFAPLLTEYIIY